MLKIEKDPRTQQPTDDPVDESLGAYRDWESVVCYLSAQVAQKTSCFRFNETFE